ncbi:putative selenate reductase subunit YgfK [Mesoterricola silvestris]|uniref:Selenate reductase subunit YgfK n=1 Tax=Mesoterricola silvestris TaxID=2927979 RepID=A0AA48GRM1_9BACT|nr:putative selenate reductase subunit YgfK [Mesoterricola silvestris]BDU72960.1 putative selenate reductase subunit YgfK [Mesoterricola silvestris]
MGKPFRPAPLEMLAGWIFRELDARDTVMGIPKANFQVPTPAMARTLFGHTVAAPLGVAAGPHSQLAQNIVSSWLCGARFIELKTVQILDEIEVARPCIDVEDEGYNCEWSQELKLEESFTEYLNAWVLLHALAHRLGLPGPGTHFAMSVGYDLQGIRTPRVQGFIASMRHGGAALADAVDRVARVYPAVRDLDIPDELSNHVTLSTMHGCPPDEIGRIATFLLTEVGVHTWIKLNPTLLGAPRLRGMLNATQGFDIEVPDSAFEHDPKFDEAVAMIRGLAATARDLPLQFGLKLTNTLEVRNHRAVFPPAEKMMYLSGRALHPLTLNLAHLLSEELDGQVPMSFCGGADAGSFPALVADGLGPVTVCTDLLKPGGYARLQQYLVNLDAAMAGAPTLDAYILAASGGHGARVNLARHAVKAAGDDAYVRRPRPLRFKGPRALGHFDCIFAPCVDGCPTNQNIPDYLWLVAHGRPREAMEVILRTNPQPGITGSVCDHPCTEKCVRMFYDAPVAIREIKRFAFERGGAFPERPGPRRNLRVAIVGAGPAGLSAAYYLAKAGFEAHVFEAKRELGGMVSGVIPGFRLTGEALGADLDRLADLGVTFHLGEALGRERTLGELRRDFACVFLGVGAQKGKRLGIPGEEAEGVVDALDFLDRVRAGTPMDLGRRVIIIGAGNTAMDAARCSRRLVKDGDVTIVYRRTRAQMPADPAEVVDCLEEGVGLRDLLAPASVVTAGGRVTGLACARMALGERDASGRARPVPVEGGEEFLPADTIIPAISQEPVLDFLDGLEVARRPDGTFRVDPATRETSVPGLFAGGDVVHGPSSIIEAIADGRAVAETIARRHGVSVPEEPFLAKGEPHAALLERKARVVPALQVPVLPVAERAGFEEVLHSITPEAAAKEASRCLDCDDLCSLCVTVCPNRAMLAFPMDPLRLALPVLVQRQGRLEFQGTRTLDVTQAVQTFNVADFCNECGNCTSFCPTAGAPYRDKPRFWIDRDGFREAADDAFRMERRGADLVLEARLQGREHRLESGPGGTVYRCGPFTARARPGSWAITDWEVRGNLPEGTEVDLAPYGTLVVLLNAAASVPDLAATPGSR